MAIATPFSFWRGGSIGSKGWGAVAGAYKHSVPVGLHVVNDVGFGHSYPGWYNDRHRYSGLEPLTSAMIHFGLAQEVVAKWQLVLDAAVPVHPEHCFPIPSAPSEF